MSADAASILVFRTNVSTPREVSQLKPVLDELAGNRGKWNFDLEDRDAILRVDIPGLSATAVVWHVQDAGFICEELEDMIYPPPQYYQGGYQIPMELTGLEANSAS